MTRRHLPLAMLLGLSAAPATAQVQLPDTAAAAAPSLSPSYVRPAEYQAPPGDAIPDVDKAMPNRYGIQAASPHGIARQAGGSTYAAPTGFVPQQAPGYIAPNNGDRYAATTPPSAAPAGASSWPIQVKRDPKPSPYIAPWQLPPNTTFEQPRPLPPIAPTALQSLVAGPMQAPVPMQSLAPIERQSVAPMQSPVVQAVGHYPKYGDSNVAPAEYHRQPPQALTAQPQPPRPSELPPAGAQIQNNVQLPPVPIATAAGPAHPSTFPTGSFRLDELVGLAVTHNPILRRELATIEAAKGERVQAGLYPNPAMETNNPEVFAGQTSFVNFGFQQFIVVKGKLRLEKAAADQLVRSATAEYRLERSRMVTEVRKQYYETLAARHRVYLARHLTSIAERGVNGARQLENAGEGTRTDVLLLDTEYQRERIRLENAETTYAGELKQLAAVVGIPEIEIRAVEGTLFDTPPVFNEQDVQAFLNHTSTYIEKSRAEITRSQMQLRREEVEMYPNLRMGPAFQTGTLPKSAQFWLTVEFEIPVWDLNQGNIRKANANVQEQLAELEILRNELNRKTAELFARHRASRERAERIRQQILPNAQQALNLIQDAYVKGQFDVNRLLESQRNLAEVSSDYFEAAEESWVTASELAGMLQIEQFP